MAAILKAAYETRIKKLEAEFEDKKAQLRAEIEGLEGIHENAIVAITRSPEAMQAQFDEMGEEKLRAHTEYYNKRIIEARSQYADQADARLASEIQRINLEPGISFMFKVQKWEPPARANSRRTCESPSDTDGRGCCCLRGRGRAA